MENVAAHEWLGSLLPHLEIGSPLTHENLTLFPLFTPESGPAIQTLDEGLVEGSVVVTEVSEAGSVPTLQVFNHGKLPLLLFDGEELVGAKQNRILNTSILVGAGATVQIPVSCVEQGRWSWRSQRFTTEGRVMKQGMRGSKAVRMARKLETMPGSYDADQRSVWQEVAEFAERRGATSSTGAMADVFEKDRPAIESFVEAIRPLPQQTGHAAFVEGRLVGIDLLGSPRAYRSLQPKLIRALAAEALDPPASWRRTLPDDPRRILERLRSARHFEARPPGLGRDVRLEIEGAGVHAAGLVADEGLVHLGVFVGG